MKHYKVNAMENNLKSVENMWGSQRDHFLPFIYSNVFVIWSRLNDRRYNSFLRIEKGDTLHLLKPKTKKEKVYFTGEVLSDLIIDENYSFSKNILLWNWKEINTKQEHIGKKEMKYIVEWEKQPYPNDELYEKIMEGYNAQSVKEIYLE